MDVALMGRKLKVSKHLNAAVSAILDSFTWCSRGGRGRPIFRDVACRRGILASYGKGVPAIEFGSPERCAVAAVIGEDWAAARQALLSACAAFASMFTLLLGYSRIPFAAARDGNFFAVLGRLHETRGFRTRRCCISGARRCSAVSFRSMGNRWASGLANLRSISATACRADAPEAPYCLCWASSTS